jgi:hypothetical protein
MSNVGRRYMWLGTGVAILLFAIAGLGLYLKMTQPELFEDRASLAGAGDYGGPIMGSQK